MRDVVVIDVPAGQASTRPSAEDYPQAVYRLSPNGTYELLFTGDKLGVKDLSDLTCWGPNCNSLLIVSQGSKRIVLSDMSGNILSSLKIKGLSRPEGLALSGNGRLMAVASEPNTFSLYSADPC
ncbi:hypothetical protein PLESTB_000054800 [Pleodorina starrii]|uniref:Uncharacterized protein n=1 Tax=Pleodorina starrii TaxID=330485 RepID=A0A9W6B9L3_9CHLO|nr:hypothetical protein PLESTB_000054800 [Pleodorina starrii]